MYTMSRESENNKYYLAHVTKAIVFLSHDNPLVQVTDNAYEHVRTEF